MNENLIVTGAEAIAKLQLNVDLITSDTTKSVEDAISAAQSYIEGLLDVCLVPKQYNDTFYLDKDSHSGIQAGGTFRLYLKTGFVKQAFFTVFVSDTWNGEQSLIVRSLVKVDLEKGILYVDADKYADKYVHVSYGAGFGSSDQVPDWLRNAVLNYLPVAYTMGSSTSSDAISANKNSSNNAYFVNTVLERYSRVVGFLIRPTMSSTIAIPEAVLS
jgi:hypothetical protein